MEEETNAESCFYNSSIPPAQSHFEDPMDIHDCRTSEFYTHKNTVISGIKLSNGPEEVVDRLLKSQAKVQLKIESKRREL